MPQQQNTPEAIKPAVVKKEVAEPTLEIANEQKE